MREANRCPRGHDLDESLDTDQWRYEVPPPAVCNACIVLDAAVKANEKDPRHGAMLYTTTKRPRPKLPQPNESG